MSFDVASIKRHPYDPAQRVYYPRSNFPLGDSDDYANTGGLLTAEDEPVLTYIAFAYKLTSDQTSHMAYPKWVVDEHFNIQARGSADATKDQMRLMMQSLLADRFKMSARWETRSLPTFIMQFEKTGQFGPQLKPAAAGCEDPSHPARVEPTPCGLSGMVELAIGNYKITGRNQTLQVIASRLGHWSMTGIERPVVDGTGTPGKFDFTVSWVTNQALAAGELSGPSYIQALREQLGLKLVPSTGNYTILVLDHIEEPTPN
jgi:uncharacterized protein (TIGR03435 family)